MTAVALLYVPHAGGLHDPPLSKLQALAKAVGVTVGRLLE